MSSNTPTTGSAVGRTIFATATLAAWALIDHNRWRRSLFNTETTASGFAGAPTVGALDTWTAFRQSLIADPATFVTQAKRASPVNILAVAYCAQQSVELRETLAIGPRSEILRVLGIDARQKLPLLSRACAVASNLLVAADAEIEAGHRAPQHRRFSEEQRRNAALVLQQAMLIDPVALIEEMLDHPSHKRSLATALAITPSVVKHVWQDETIAAYVVELMSGSKDIGNSSPMRLA